MVRLNIPTVFPDLGWSLCRKHQNSGNRTTCWCEEASWGGQICLPGFPGFCSLCSISDVAAWTFIFKRQIPNWAVLLEAGVHASVDFCSKAVSGILGIRINGNMAVHIGGGRSPCRAGFD